MNTNWNWILDGNSIIKEIDPIDITQVIPSLGSSISKICKSFRGTMSDTDYMNKFGLVDRITEGTPVAAILAATDTDINCMYEKDKPVSWKSATNSFTSSPAIRDINYISYSLINFIKSKLSLVSNYEVFNELNISLEKYELAITVGTTSNGISYGYNKDETIGNISYTNIIDKEVQAILSNSTMNAIMLRVSDRLFNSDTVYITLLGRTIKVDWDESAHFYLGSWGNIIKTIEDIGFDINNEKDMEELSDIYEIYTMEEIPALIAKINVENHNILDDEISPLVNTSIGVTISLNN